MFTPTDLRQLQEAGIERDEALRQMRLFERPKRYLELVRPCRLGDGIRVIDEHDPDLLARYEQARDTGRLLRFVPASGAASRMFRSLLWARSELDTVTRADLARRAQEGEENAQETLRTIDRLPQLPFYQDLLPLLAKAPSDDLHHLIDCIVGDEGLAYAALPKGLIKFHCNADGARTPFEEHLLEAASCMKSSDGRVSMHFTVSPEHLDAFRSLLADVRSLYERRCSARFDVEFSLQKRATDTLAVDLENRPFRDDEGRLLLRPGGHGALIENLNDLDADVIHIQNIDNVVPDRLRAEVVRWKQLLIGEFVVLQRQLFAHVAALRAASTDASEAVEAASDFVCDVLHAAESDEIRRMDASARRGFVLERLDRPLRVCGMVPNSGDTGGGPFWVRDPRGRLSLQIVEGAEVNPGSPKQQSIYQASTHFNPVHLVCGVRDSEGQRFDLHRFVDPEAVFIAEKSSGGRALRALERPGLWNGAMADWNTLFIEIPLINFSPVKTVNDLLRPEHRGQPG